MDCCMLVRSYTLVLFLCELQKFRGRINSLFCQRHIHIGVVAWAACKGVERPFSGMRFSNNFQCKHSEKKPKQIYFGCRRACPPAILSTGFALCRIISLEKYTKNQALAVNDLWRHTDRPGAFWGIVRPAGTSWVLLRPTARCNFGSS